jgi:PDZ domain-containing protein
MVVPSPLAWQSIPTRPRRPWRWALGALGLLVAAFIILNAITIPYYGILPGPTYPVDGPQGAVVLHSAHAGSGDLSFVVVVEQPRVSEWDRLTYPFLRPEVDLFPIAEITGGLPQTQYNQENAQLMVDSQQAAKVAALRRLGYHVPELGDGAAVEQVNPRTPADGKVRQGDVITAADGKPIKVASDLTSVISSLRPGSVVHLTLKRPIPKGTTSVQLDLGTIACGPTICPGEPNRALMGVEVATDRQSFAFPAGVDVNIVTSGIGGPSAGLSFALGVLDALTTRDITGGRLVAATGTIDPDGNVGDVGGVRQKTIAVRNAHAQFFIVPRVEYPAAKAAAGGKLTVVPVDTLDQALTFLRSIGGNLTGIPATAPPPVPE